MPDMSLQRRVFARLSIFSGNVVQIAGLTGAVLVLVFASSTSSRFLSIAAMLVSWTLVYFCCHGIAHWLVGRLVGIHFRFYTVGGTGNPQGWPAGLRWIFEHLPFFGVQTEKASIENAGPRAKALMWSAGVTSSAIAPTLVALAAWRLHLPGSTLFLVSALAWAVGTVSSNWRSSTGDYTKARRALGRV